MPNSPIIKRLVYFLLLLGIGLLLYDRFRLGLVRYLDLDEYAHLHWSYDVFSGLTPYKDFFYVFTPFYLYIIAPLLLITGKTFSYILAARVLSFLIFLMGVFFLFLIARNQRNILFALFTSLIFIYLPLPEDKWLEIRPDGLGTVLGLVGIYFTFAHLRNEKKLELFLSGLFLGLGVMVSPKVIFYPISIIAALAIDQVIRKSGIKSLFRNQIYLLAGLVIALIILLVSFVNYGDFKMAFYSVFILHQTAGQFLSQKFPISPNLFFYPNGYYYGTMNIDFNYLINLLIYTCASFFAIKNLITFLSVEKRIKRVSSLIFSSLLLSNLFAYVKVFPLKHTQYLIALSPFIAYSFADLLFGSVELLKKKQILRFVYMFIVSIFIINIVRRGHQMNNLKARLNNSDAVLFLSLANKYFSENDFVWDLTGASLFYKDPYYICCLPYGDYREVLKFNLPDLKSSLIRNQVKYIFIQDLRMLKRLPVEHINTVNRYYTGVSETTMILFAGSDISFENKLMEEEFELIADGWYRVYFDGKKVTGRLEGISLLIDGKKVTESVVYIKKGMHILTKYGNVKSVKLAITKKESI